MIILIYNTLTYSEIDSPYIIMRFQYILSAGGVICK